jgi:hypothetical protein
MVTPKISTVKPLEKMRLLICFANGVEKNYDCSPLLNRESFELLKTEAFFRAVRVDPGGYGVSWNDDVDLSDYELWVNGVNVIEK